MMKKLSMIAITVLFAGISTQFFFNPDHPTESPTPVNNGFSSGASSEIKITAATTFDYQTELPRHPPAFNINASEIQPGNQINWPKYNLSSQQNSPTAPADHTWLPGDYLSPDEHQNLKLITTLTDSPENIQQLRSMLQTVVHPEVLNAIINKMIAFDQGRENGRFITDMDQLLMGLVYSGQITDEDHVYSGLEYLDRHLPENEFLVFLENLSSGGPLEANVASQVFADIEIIQQNLEILHN